MKKIRLWKFLYLIFFLIVSFFALKDDFDKEYPVVFDIFAVSAYVIFNVGIVFYAINFQNDTIRSLWKWFFPFLVAFFFASLIFDTSRNEDLRYMGTAPFLFLVLIGGALFYPAFRAAFFLAFRKLNSGL
jgi:hypothetical protein